MSSASGRTIDTCSAEFRISRTSTKKGKRRSGCQGSSITLAKAVLWQIKQAYSIWRLKTRLICTLNLALIRLHCSFKTRRAKQIRDMGPRKTQIIVSLVNSWIKLTSELRLYKTNTQTLKRMAMKRCGLPLSTTQPKKLQEYSIRGLSYRQQRL